MEALEKSLRNLLSELSDLMNVSVCLQTLMATYWWCGDMLPKMEILAMHLRS